MTDAADDVSGAGSNGEVDGQVDDAALRSMHAELDAIDEVHVDDRTEVFERLNRALAHELAALDEV